MKRISLFFAALLSFFLLPFSSCSVNEKYSLYDMTCSYDEETATVSGSLDFTFVNKTGEELSVLWFHLYPNAYRQGALYSPVSPIHKTAYYDGDSYGEIVIESVDGAYMWEIGGEDRNILYVTLASPLKAGEKTRINISFQTSLAKVNHRLGLTEHTVSLSNFYPVLCAYDKGTGFYECVYYSDGDPFYSDCADYRVSLTVPKEYVVASSGVVEGSTGTLETTTYTLSSSKMRDFSIVMSKEFSVETQTVGETTVSYYHYADENPSASLQAACLSLSWFSDMFGEYVYDTYCVVESGFCYGGMEYPALSIVSDSLEESYRLRAIVHETAHQWWYAMVGNNQSEYAWMDEGLSEYSTALFFDNHPEYGFDKESIVSAARASFRAFNSIYRQLFDEADTTMNRNLSSFISEYEYVNIAYCKGMILFDSVYAGLGKDKFFYALRNYASSYLYQNATPDDMIKSFKRTGTDIGGLFDSFIDGTAVL